MTKVFISYSHQDEVWKNRLQTQLTVLEMEGLLSVWEDQQIEAGDDWFPEIERALNGADVAILLISANFLGSKFIRGTEVPRLLERRKKEGIRVIPLILKPCLWQTVEWLTPIQGRPKDNKPLSGFSEHEA
ncbi:MAG: toll/interleukin-1 receptor domain-containing protein [Thiotrichales bacterium]